MVGFVVDASLATKWVVLEDQSELADAFFVEYFGRMHVPDLLLVEVCGSLVRRVNQRDAVPADALEGVEEVRRRTVEAISLHRITPDLAVEAARLAIGFGHPIKDCVYLALADALGVALVTCDVKFHDRVGDPARVRLLADLA